MSTELTVTAKAAQAVSAVASVLGTVSKSVRDSYFALSEVRDDFLLRLHNLGDRKVLMMTKGIVGARNPDCWLRLQNCNSREDWAELRAATSEMLDDIQEILRVLKKQNGPLLLDEAYDALLKACAERRAFVAVMPTEMPSKEKRRELLQR